MTDHTVLIAL